MGPKKKDMGKKGKKGNRREKNAVQPKTTKSQYIAKIAEINAILAQLRRETYTLEGEYFNAEKRYEQIQEDLADVIKYLEHEIKVAEEDIAVYDLGINNYIAEIERQKKYYEEIYARMDEQCEIKKRELTEKIESANAKLNSFAEVRQQREELLRRKEMLMKLVEEMRSRHAQETYEGEKQAIIEQDKLQKEMENKLAHLALDFRDATDIRIGETTNSIIKKNIKLGNMLTCQQEYLTKLRDHYRITKKIQKHANLDLELIQDEFSLTQEKYNEHSTKIEALLEVIEEMTRQIDQLKKLFKINRRLKRKIKELECYLKDLTDEYSALAKSVEEVEDSTESAKSTLTMYQKNVLKQQSQLFDAAKKVKKAIESEDSTQLGFKEIVQREEISEQEGDLADMEDLQKENIYRMREDLIEEVFMKLQSVNLSTDEIYPTASSIVTNENTFSHHSSLDISPTPKRSLMAEIKENEELTH